MGKIINHGFHASHKWCAVNSRFCSFHIIFAKIDNGSYLSPTLIKSIHKHCTVFMLENFEETKVNLELFNNCAVMHNSQTLSLIDPRQRLSCSLTQIFHSCRPNRRLVFRIPQCGNYRILLLPFCNKNSVKSTFPLNV